MIKAGIVFLFMIGMLSGFTQHKKDFTLQSVDQTKSFTLSKAKGKFVALHFLLKTECPYCIRHTNDYAEKASTLPDVIQIFIKPDEENEVKQWSTKLAQATQSTFPIYRDPKGELADAFQIPSGYAFHGQIVHYPALILLNKKGKEVFRYVGKNNSDRYSFEKLKSKIEELR